MGVRALMAALRGSEEPDPGPDAVSGPTEERGRLERRVRGPRSGEGGAATLLREGEARVRVAGPVVAAAAAERDPARRVAGRRLGCEDCCRTGPPDTSSARRGRLRRRSMADSGRKTCCKMETVSHYLWFLHERVLYFIYSLQNTHNL